VAALRPGDFGDEMMDSEGRAIDGSCWEIAGWRYRRNPVLRLTSEDWAMARLWGQYRGGGLGGVGHLPEAGGTGDQAAIMLDAFALMSEAVRPFEEKDRS
jgi:hypothetical protein